MEIETTISAMVKGVCLFETDVTAVIDYKFDRRHNELEWWVDEYIIKGNQRIWSKDGKSSHVENVRVAVPKALADAFDEFLDREHLDEKVRERLADYGDDRADYLRDQMMDR